MTGCISLLDVVAFGRTSGSALADLQKLGENHRLKCEGWQRERTGLVPEMLFLATALSV